MTFNNPSIPTFGKLIDAKEHHLYTWKKETGKVRFKTSHQLSDVELLRKARSKAMSKYGFKNPNAYRFVWTNPSYSRDGDYFVYETEVEKGTKITNGGNDGNGGRKDPTPKRPSGSGIRKALDWFSLNMF